MGGVWWLEGLGVDIGALVVGGPLITLYLMVQQLRNSTLLIFRTGASTCFECLVLICDFCYQFGFLAIYVGFLVPRVVSQCFI